MVSGKSFRLSSLSRFISFSIMLADVQILGLSLTLDSDVQVLRSLKQSIDPISINSVSYLNSWNFSMDPCESTGGFLGILCTVPEDNSSNRISVIDLDAAGYDGYLSPTIGNLTELIELSLSENQLRGPIPETISNLKKLTRLSLSNNFFTGGIPRGVTSLELLEVMDLSGNHLSGEIPPNLSRLRRLSCLSLSGNSFSGRIPDLSGLWRLNALDLRNNLLYGNLAGLPKNLRTLNVAHNTLSGHISPLRALQHLETLDVSDNRFTGMINGEVLALPLVVHINASVNHFTTIEPTPYHKTDMKLQALDAHANQLRGHLPDSLAAVESLTSLDLSHNLFFGSIPEEYGQKLGKPWKRLFLQSNLLSGNLPSQFISGKAKITGSLENNCLRCPPKVSLCRGGQRPSPECTRYNGRS